ncbi:transcription-repair coupling factor [Nitzschia inconspicua]|uniref:Transcription-repair coupling factor n=1 Tax=Nitzschia inconspicua TaxID=303405 RepID=A0A9K3Q1R7_9STRA|nr:transcription-repair coupling factor [Nitzschia inconspicua]
MLPQILIVLFYSISWARSFVTTWPISSKVLPHDATTANSVSSVRNLQNRHLPTRCWAEPPPRGRRRVLKTEKLEPLQPKTQPATRAKPLIPKKSKVKLTSKDEEDEDAKPIRPMRSDVTMTFGSQGDSVDEDEEDEYDKEQRNRRRKVQDLLVESDKEFLEERRRKVWGDFADAKSKADILKVEQSMKEKIAKENEIKALVARQQQGVELEIIEPPDDTGSVFDVSDNVKIQGGSAKAGESWFAEMDQDLKQEWEAMEGVAMIKSNGDDEASSVNGAPSTVNVNGKIVSRDALKGVRVGSAGGWTLEVFPGDFVVHRKYGIGRFERTCLRPLAKLTPEQMEAREKRRRELVEEEISRNHGGLSPQQILKFQQKFGTEEDTDPVSNPQAAVLEISYADGIVHVPVDRAYRLSRYRAGDSVVKPRLSKVRGDQWRSARRKVEETTLELAQDVLALYATRETLTRPPFDPAKEDEVKEFEKTFQYDPTKDQQKCFEDVENDMVWRSRPMDRLVCGDVGFGKTEVAMRAIYRAVVNGRQAALLAPTGVLASQHYKNIVKRVGEGTKFNKRVALLRGGMTRMSKAGKELREKIKEGEFDIIVGTHALLSRDLEYKDLGLLVVDEEQRFGVKQKERLKLICGGIDVLTLSATPIPRTLQMSLSGVRDTSTIRSAPPMRKPTVTYVQDFNEDIVKFAIGQELERGGQCYYVVPRIAMLEEAKETITECFPGIRIIMAHGKMGRNVAEENVAAFAEGQYDILLATTVIENGVDIPTVNTIVIQDSQIFGMSTLYQLRGRVGRSDLQGYAYFLYKGDRVTEQSVMRLQAIGELNELGSGFDVANRDLEIRGAGSLLGTEQSGMAAKVGFDLYMRMLKKSIRQLRGLDLPLVPRTNIILPKGEGSMEIRKTNSNGDTVSVHAFQIPEEYIPDSKERQTAETAARLAESSAALVELTKDWKEKYGPVPASLQTKLKTMHLHSCTRRLGIDLIGLMDNGNGRIDCIMRSPGLRPRHWGIILPLLPKGVAPKGLDVMFPARLTKSGSVDQEVKGGETVDLKALLEDPSLDEDNDKWDALDEEEVEAMKEIASAYEVKSLDEIDVEAHPRLVMKGFGTGPKAVDRLLKVLLPVAKVVQDQQNLEKEQAKVAADLREKRELLSQRKKENETKEMQRYLM